MLNRSAKIFFTIFFLVLTGSVIITYNRYIVDENFFVYSDPDNVPSGSLYDLPSVIDGTVFDNNSGVFLWEN